jgi:hypothetical protein
MVYCGAETWKFRKTDEKYLEGLESGAGQR